MEANEKTFRHSFFRVIPMFVIVLFLGFLAISFNQISYFLFGIAGVAFVGVLFYAANSVKISNEEIVTSGLLGSKSLHWPEIARVSTRGQSLRLHNYDDDLVLSIDSQLEGYAEIVNVIFRKRADLFDNNENTTMSFSWLGSISTLGAGLFNLAISVIWLFTPHGFERFFSLFFLATGLYLIGLWFFAPKSLALESRDLIVRYFFKEASYSADDISSISLEKQSTRNGYVYFVQINLKSGKKIKLPAFKQGVPLTYQILKRWHEKAARLS